MRNINYGDLDSVGLFQQRPRYWGTVAELTDPVIASTKFYMALVKVKGWEQLPLTQAAQKVQISAYPEAYAKWEIPAEAIVNSMEGS